MDEHIGVDCALKREQKQYTTRSYADKEVEQDNEQDKKQHEKQHKKHNKNQYQSQDRDRNGFKNQDKYLIKCVPAE